MDRRLKIVHFELKQYGFFVHYCTSNEMMITLKLRSKLASSLHTLNKQERLELLAYDRLLLHNANRFRKQQLQYLCTPAASYPAEEWWWHLDQVADGSLHICLPSSDLF
jgi:hypothetical protein